MSTRPARRLLAVRAPWKTSQGRRVRQLFRAYMAALGEGYSGSTLAQAVALQCAELRFIGERLRAEMLAKPKHDLELSEELVRFENMIRRTENELTDAIPERKETHQEFIQRVYNANKPAPAQKEEG
jgi:hypothetical protein